MPKFGHGFGIGKENDIRDSDDRSAGCEILVSEKEAGIRDPDPWRREKPVISLGGAYLSV